MDRSAGLVPDEPALRLYAAAEFAKISEMADMFRMDGQSFALITMTKRIRARAN